MWRQIAMFGLGWIGIVLLSLGWEYYSGRQHEAQNILEVSRAFFKQIVITREWNARHGGVYVFTNDTTQPNPYLKDPERDILLGDGRMITKINPAYMTRQLSELSAELEGTEIHITSLKPIRPENAPAPWERTALKAFEAGLPELGSFEEERFRYMAPLTTSESCLKCHREQGYKLGDIRGGISITIPYSRYDSLKPLLLGHLLVALTGLLLIFFFGRKLSRVYLLLKEQSIIDPLTQIPNRRFFLKRSDEEFRRAAREHEPLALIMADIDYFKLFNDRYGHLEGDACLKTVADTMKSMLRRPPDCIARFGGEEFIILLPDTPAEGAAKVAEQLRSAVEELQINNEPSLCGDVVTISLGVAASENGKTPYEALLKEADKALYRAKEKGRNRVETAPLPVPPPAGG